MFNWSLTLTEGHRLRVLMTRILRKPFGPKRKGKAGDWKKLHNEETHNCYSLTIVTRVIKLRGVGCDGWDMSHVGGEVKLTQEFCGGKLKNREYLQDLVVDGRIILKRIFKQ